MKIAYDDVFNFKQLVRTKDSWGDRRIQVRGRDFPRRMKELKAFKVYKYFNSEFLNLIRIDGLTLYNGKIKIQNGNAYCPVEHAEFEDADICIRKKYYDFANTICPDATIYVSLDKVFWVKGENLSENWQVAVVAYNFFEK